MIDKLNFVLALAREHHFGRAAEICGVTQPTMSAGLKQLEEQLGVVIVRRSSRFQGFTPEGEHVLAWARRIVGDAAAMRQDLDALKGGLAGHLRLAAIPTALGIVPSLTTPFRIGHPSVRFTVTSATSTDILDGLTNLSVDAGLTYLDNEAIGGVKTVPLYRETYCLLTSADSDLGRRATIGWRDIGTLPLCLMTPDMQNRRIVDQMLRDSDAPSEAPLESNSVLALLAHVASGLWSSIVPTSLVRSIGLPPKTVAVPIGDPEVSHLVGLVVAPRYAISPLTNALVQEAERLADRLMPPKPSRMGTFDRNVLSRQACDALEKGSEKAFLERIQKPLLGWTCRATHRGTCPRRRPSWPRGLTRRDPRSRSCTISWSASATSIAPSSRSWPKR